MATMENRDTCTKVIKSSTFKNGHYCTLAKLVYDRQCYSTSVCVCVTEIPWVFGCIFLGVPVISAVQS